MATLRLPTPPDPDETPVGVPDRRGPRLAVATRPPVASDRRPVSNGRIAIVMLLATETMFFAGLIAAYIVLRQGAADWPPIGQPRLPLLVTWINTAVLLASALTMFLAERAVRQRAPARLLPALCLTGFLGLIFVAIQGSEWTRLLRYGLTLQSSTYGATFYTLIGTHGAHVLVAVAWLCGVCLYALREPVQAVRTEYVGLCALYWYFVCALWPFLFGLVYLS